MRYFLFCAVRFGNFFAYLAPHGEKLAAFRPFGFLPTLFQKGLYHQVEFHILLFLVYAVGTFRLRERFPVLFWYCLFELALLVCVSTEDWSRYFLAMAPFALVVGFHDVIDTRVFRWMLPVFAALSVYYAWGVIPLNGCRPDIYLRLLAHLGLLPPARRRGARGRTARSRREAARPPAARRRPGTASGRTRTRRGGCPAGTATARSRALATTTGALFRPAAPARTGKNVREKTTYPVAFRRVHRGVARSAPTLLLFQARRDGGPGRIVVAAARAGRCPGGDRSARSARARASPRARRAPNAARPPQLGHRPRVLEEDEPPPGHLEPVAPGTADAVRRPGRERPPRAVERKQPIALGRVSRRRPPRLPTRLKYPYEPSGSFSKR